VKLAELQKQMIKSFFNQDSSADTQIISDQRLTAKQRLDIYKGSIHGSLTRTLAITFPVCQSLVGVDFFDKMVDIFIDQNPPDSPYFIEYGGDFSLFIKNFEPIKSLPYLAEIADFEWTRHQVWHTKLINSVDFSPLESLSNTQQNSLQFILAPSLQLKEYQYAVDQIWFAHQKETHIILEEVNITQGIKCILWRNSQAVQLAIPELGIWDFLQAIKEKNRLPELATRFMDQMPNYLTGAIQNQWIQDYSFLSDLSKY